MVVAAAVNVAALVVNPLQSSAEERATLADLVRSEELLPLCPDRLLWCAQVQHSSGTTHDTAKWIPYHEIKGVEIRGVCRLVFIDQQCSPNPTHVPRHDGLCCIGSVSRCTIHNKEAVGVNDSSQPREEAAHCCNECPGNQCLTLLENVEPGPPIRCEDSQDHESQSVPATVDASVTGITCSCLNQPILC